jgi:hypothetical protein
VDITCQGRGRNVDINRLSITHSSHLAVHGDASLHAGDTDDERYMSGRIQNIYADTEGLTLLAQSLGERKISETLQTLGYIHLTGEAEGHPDAIHLSGHLRTEVGEAETQLTMLREAEGRTYSGHITGSGVDLGRILQQPDTFGETDFDL